MGPRIKLGPDSGRRARVDCQGGGGGGGVWGGGGGGGHLRTVQLSSMDGLHGGGRPMKRSRGSISQDTRAARSVRGSLPQLRLKT